jgi:1-hydroxycarotenoid 3,4-desaturase
LREQVIIVGAGIGGLAAAVDLSARGAAVTVLERAARPGGKMREIVVGGRPIDSGPTVFTMRWVFEELFAAAGTSVAAELSLQQADVLARHAWSDTERLDLYADLERSAEAVGAFSGAEEARRFLAFSARAKETYDTLEGPFLRSSRPNFLSLTQRVGLAKLPQLLRLQPFTTLWDSLGGAFRDPRLQQLYGRYATYCGSSPFQSPALLMLVAHVEQDGVWMVEGGMYRLAEALARVATRLGATIRCEADVSEITTAGGAATGVRLTDGERIEADAVLFNGDASAIGSGLLGPGAAAATRPVEPGARSLSAMAWSAVVEPSGFPLLRHSVFFSRDYRREFTRIFDERRLPDDPTVYVCAQDRGDRPRDDTGPERVLILVNAPATGDGRPFTDAEIASCQDSMLARLRACGLKMELRPDRTVLTTPADFARLFPGTGGAIYGRASHGWRASFLRPDARTPIPGLYLAGGSVHPGPGVPMAALSGRLAAQSVLSDFASTRPSRRAAISGGMSTR